MVAAGWRGSLGLSRSSWRQGSSFLVAFEGRILTTLFPFSRSPVGQLEGWSLLVFAPFAGGCLFVDGFEVRFGEVGVNLSRGDVGMAEHLLNVPHTGSAFEHFGRASVPKAVGRDALRQVRFLAIASDEPPKGVHSQGRSGPIQKEHGGGIASTFLISFEDERSHSGDVFSQVFQGSRKLPVPFQFAKTANKAAA